MNRPHVFLIISLLLHCVLFFKENIKSDKIKPIQEKKVNLKLIKKTQVEMKTLKTKKSKLEKITFSMLGIPSLEKVDSNQYEVKSNKYHSIQKSNLLFNAIEEQLIYPNELVENNIQGHVSVRIYLNKGNQYDEKLTKIKGASPFIKVHIARTLRKVLIPEFIKNLNIKKLTRYNIVFNFKLTSEKRAQDESRLLEDSFYFYRQEYGVSSKGDKIIKGVDKTLMNLTNWFTLLEYLPDSDQTKQRKMRIIKSYEDDLFF